MDHIGTIMRRNWANGVGLSRIAMTSTVFAGATEIEGVHPLQCGLIRRKVRTQRRHGIPLENPLIFYPRRIVESCVVAYRWISLFMRIRRIRKKIQEEPTSRQYTDEAIRIAAATDTDEVVHLYADKIPKTHGAPVREAVQA